MSIIRTNTIPSKVDNRDRVYVAKSQELPSSIDLRQYDSQGETQGKLGSCTANAITSCYEVLVNILYPDKFVELSRLYVYYHSRLFDDDLEFDKGSTIRNGLKSVKNYGVCSETLWPYDITKFTEQPTPPCYLDGTKRKIVEYNVLYENNEIKEVLANKCPVVLGIEIFYDFTNINKDNNTVPVPVNFAYSLGGHAVTIMGYDNDKNSFLIKNSWGIDWGDNGYAWLPYDYVDTYGFDKWCFNIDNQGTNLV